MIAPLEALWHEEGTGAAWRAGCLLGCEEFAGHESAARPSTASYVPFDIDTGFSRHVGFRFVRFISVHVLPLRTPMGRGARRKAMSQGDPLVRVKPKWLDAAGVQRVEGKVVGVQEGLPVLEDGQVLDVANVIWCTGFRHDLSWIDLPIFGEDGAPMHDRGVVTSEPGLYFVGLPFQFAVASDGLPGIGRDARHVVRRLIARDRTAAPAGGQAAA